MSTQLYRIGIDPGHPSSFDRNGKRADGVVVPGLAEADYVMGMARFLLRRIEHSCEPFDPVLLRKRDGEVVSLAERARRAHAAGVLAVISLHVNSAPSKRWHGALALSYGDDPIAWEIGNAILSAMPEELQNKRHLKTKIALPHLWPRAHNVLEPHIGYPTLLLELGYATNHNDLKALLTPSIQSAVVAAIMVGLARFRVIFDREKE